MADHWQFFNYANVLSEAKQRLAEARRHGFDLGSEKDTLEYWCGWCAHANAAAVLLAEIDRLRQALEPFATVPPGGYGETERLMVTGAGGGPFHFLESDLARAKATFRRGRDRPSEHGRSP